MKKNHLLIALCALILPAVLLAGCGGIPKDSVANVDGETVTKAQLTSALQQAAQGAGSTTVPVPPSYTQCIAEQRKALGKPKKGQPVPTNKELAAKCKQQYDQLLSTAMGQLLQTIWITKEAKDMGISVSDAEVQQTFEAQKKQAFPKEKDYQKFLKQRGETTEDLMKQVKVGLLGQKISKKVSEGKGNVTDKQIEEFYNKNKAQFSQPARRDLLVVLAKTKAKADAAKKALDSGQSFGAVAKTYSVDQASKSQGGKLLGVAKGQQEKTFDQAIFQAKKDVLVGPVKTQFGYYLFKVTKTTPASQQTLAQVKPSIKQQLTSTNQQTALSEFISSWTRKWTKKTDCLKGYIVPQCKNAPKEPVAQTPPPPIKNQSQQTQSPQAPQTPQAPAGQ